MYKEDLASNNLQWLICHEMQTKQTCIREVQCKTPQQQICSSPRKYKTIHTKTWTDKR